MDLLHIALQHCIPSLLQFYETITIARLQLLDGLGYGYQRVEGETEIRGGRQRWTRAEDCPVLDVQAFNLPSVFLSPEAHSFGALPPAALS